MKRFSLLLLLVSNILTASDGHWANPITDVCWECMFPITVSGVNVTPDHKEHSLDKKVFCACNVAGKIPQVGLPLSFWEPSSMVDVTRHAYKLIGLGGISIGKESIKNRGTVSPGPALSKSSFYHVHYYKWPLLSWLGLLADLTCVSKSPMDIPYISELDISWNNDQVSLILSPEAFLFANPVAQAACIADCAAATAGRNCDLGFWCAGCQGSLYPLAGSVAHHSGGVQMSSLLVHRLIARMHRVGLLYGYEKGNFCEAKSMRVIKKSLYKTQMTYPVAQTKGPCNVLGRSGLIWGAGKSYPVKGEDFVYLIWMKRKCCLNALPLIAVPIAPVVL